LNLYLTSTAMWLILDLKSNANLRINIMWNRSNCHKVEFVMNTRLPILWCIFSPLHTNTLYFSLAMAITFPTDRSGHQSFDKSIWNAPKIHFCGETVWWGFRHNFFIAFSLSLSLSLLVLFRSDTPIFETHDFIAVIIVQYWSSLKKNWSEYLVNCIKVYEKIGYILHWLLLHIIFAYLGL